MSDMVDWDEDDSVIRPPKPGRKSGGQPKAGANPPRQPSEAVKPNAPSPPPPPPPPREPPKAPPPPRASEPVRPASPPNALPGDPWALLGVPSAARNVAMEAARRRGMAPGAWLAEAIGRAVKGEADDAKRAEAPRAWAAEPAKERTAKRAAKPTGKRPGKAKPDTRPDKATIPKAARRAAKADKRAAKAKSNKRRTTAKGKKGAARPLLARLFSRR